MIQRVTLTLILWGSCGWLISNCEGQVPRVPSFRLCVNWQLAGPVGLRAVGLFEAICAKAHYGPGPEWFPCHMWFVWSSYGIKGRYCIHQNMTTEEKNHYLGYIYLFSPTSDVNCTCKLGHGKCSEDGDCRCDPGWGGPFCEDCVRMPGCVHGSCHQPWQCTCLEGWTGRFCDKDIHVCEKEKPCQNGATCFLNDAGEYNCLCPDGFHGKNCEFMTGPCHKTKSPCKNGGLCEDLGGFAPELTCRCLVGFTGPYCETNMDDCLMRPCANGATCVDGVNRFSCLCPAGFTGRFCTVNLDDCASQPCLNGGRCIDRVTNFHCLCPAGYTGRTCEVPLGEKGLPTQAPHKDFGWGGGGFPEISKLPQITPNKPYTYTSGNYSQGITTTGDKDHLLKISVKEVVTQSAAAGLSEEHFIILIVLGGLTLAVVALTAGLVLRGHWHNICVCSHCRAPTSKKHSFQRCRTQQRHLAAAQQDCKISFLHTSAPPELEKKRLNTEVI